MAQASAGGEHAAILLLVDELYGWLYETGNAKQEPNTRPCCAIFGFDNAVYEHLHADIPSKAMKTDLAKAYGSLFCNIDKRSLFHAASKFGGVRTLLGQGFEWVRTTHDAPVIARTVVDSAVATNVRLLYTKALFTLRTNTPQLAKREFVDKADQFQVFPVGCTAFMNIKFSEDERFTESFLTLVLSDYLLTSGKKS